ncbi:Atg29p Ecym_2379 [Eremothecium cymbalariae DBVPG|uniref:Autophagy-related protein 29 n=1 Tax=Eremothecium cymbalariae (strain CBS 270.75 / DBVPG 7215 / KCTC 17166 / NRRL Y-17582) TaxID=931890 RepID=G8JNP4_ERECY|nr:Hypothetical protein Ecym_2379 [Eremothecium cymbalariae DBVPG\
MDIKNTIVYIKVPGRRWDGFVDHPKFRWNYEQEKKLWSLVSTLDNKDEIDWELLVKELKAPEFFLRKRTYKLFSNHLKSLERQVHNRTSVSPHSMGLVDDMDPQPVTLSTKVPKETNALDNLHILKSVRPKPPRDEDVVDSSGTSELSSLSVSKSALEEALMDRLQL